MRSITDERFLQMLEETFANGATFALTITGNSMEPTFRNGQDRVILSPLERPLRKGDVPLYRRDDGTIVLHRVVAVHSDGTIDCCGDHQLLVERNIRPQQVLAVGTAFVRSGRAVSAKAWRYRFPVWLHCKWRDLRRWRSQSRHRPKPFGS